MRISKILLVLITITLFSCKDDDDNDFLVETPNVSNPIYLDSNEVTIKAYDWAKVGDSGMVNGVFYTVIGRRDLENLILTNSDITAVCVSKLESLSYLFSGALDFNQDISSWDVSNVTNMRGLFAGKTAFNQDIGSWNVANVTNMGGMFVNAINFNQNIGSWNVANVTFCGSYSSNTSSWTLAKPNFTSCNPN